MPPKTAQFSCILCQGEKHKIKYDYVDVGVYSCLQCGLMALFPQPSMDRLKKIYSEDYFRNSNFFNVSDEQWKNLYGYYDYFSERANKQYQLNQLASELYSKCRHQEGGERPRLLEVGCGLGYFLDTAFDTGFDVVGIEFNPSAVKSIRRKYCFPIFEGAFPEIQLPEMQYDAICAFDVIEHLHDPVQSVKKLHNYLKSNGYLVLVTMDASSIMSHLIGKRLEDFRRTSEHLFFFDRSTITRLLEGSGFIVREIRSMGHTFQLGHLLDRCNLIIPHLFSTWKKIIWPRWLLKANFYVDFGTKICVFASKKI